MFVCCWYLSLHAHTAFVMIRLTHALQSCSQARICVWRGNVYCNNGPGLSGLTASTTVIALCRCTMLLICFSIYLHITQQIYIYKFCIPNKMSKYWKHLEKTNKKMKEKSTEKHNTQNMLMWKYALKRVTKIVQIAIQNILWSSQFQMRTIAEWERQT